MTDIAPDLLSYAEAKAARDHALALAARDHALALFEKYRKPWLERAREAADRIYERNGHQPISVNDVRLECPPDPGDDPRKFGGVFNTKEWEALALPIKSARKRCHHRDIKLFRKVVR